MIKQIHRTLRFLLEGIADLLQDIAKWVCRQMGRSEELWREVLWALPVAAVFTLGLLAAYALLAFLTPGVAG